ncbi:uncharacterized protein ACNLHF_002545 isoform 1-T3 [Anomaloglossus baeobatrachus]|uniref:uncharacterized protein LOC142256329 n=1 Tax=Anomaloglossus baeobatrachus TaxID=238106 RepID=UPI003F50BE5C
MKNLVTLICVIFALVSSVFSYKCYSAFCYNATKCDLSEIESHGYPCRTTSQYDEFYGMIGRAILKGFTPEAACGIIGLAASLKYKIHFRVKCCFEDYCNTDGFCLPKEDTRPNGVKCPVAHCTGTLEECKTDQEMACTGSMNQCFEYREHLTNRGQRDGKYSMKGCANSVMCNLSFHNNFEPEVLKKRYGNCYDPSQCKKS